MNQADLNNELKLAVSWYQNNKNLALATVIKTWGSAPRPVGSYLLIDNENNFAGSVSGGCIESAVILEAQDVIETKKTKVIEYGVSNEDAIEVGLACGGEIKILLQAISNDLIESIEKIIELQSNRIQFASTTNLVSGEVSVKTDTNNIEAGLTTDSFTLINKPNIRVCIIGGVHITQFLIKYIENLDFEYYVIDPRTAWANEKRFQGANIINNWSDLALQEIGLDKYTAVVTLTHDPKLDDPGLITALKSDCYYIGALGSTRTHAKRIERLKIEGFTEEELKRIHAPVGLSIKAKSASEIALSIISQIVSEYRSNL